MKYLIILLPCLFLTFANAEPLFEILSNDLDAIDPYQIIQPVQVDESLLIEDVDTIVDETNEVIPVEDVKAEVPQEDEIINSVDDVNAFETLENSSVVEPETPAAKPQPFFVELYEVGKKSYLSNDFKNCVSNIEEALKSYAEYTSAILRCKVKCDDEAENAFVPMATVDIGNLHFYEKMVKRTLCLMNCKNSSMPELTVQMPKEVMDDFEMKMPYDYLQLCYYQLKEFVPASSAAFTYHVYNPDSVIMKDNIHWYSNKLNNKTDFVNREPFLHTASYKAGVTHYSEGEWEESVENFEKAIAEFIQAEDQCRLECEKPFDMGWFPDFVTAVANHFVFCLKCKLHCQTKLANLDGNAIENIFPLMYNYLQFSYYKLGKIEQAVQCVESYLLIDPNDANMASNKLYYQTQEKADLEWFRARPEAEKYFNRDQYEKKILEFIYAEFSYYNKPEDEGPKLQNKDADIFKNAEAKKKGDLSLLDSTD